MRSQVTWCYSSLDEVKMHIAAQALIGEHDFLHLGRRGVSLTVQTE